MEKMECKIEEQYLFRSIRKEEAMEAAKIEEICFPPNEACKPEIMIQRAELFAETFLVAIEKETGKMVGFINGLATNEGNLRDEFFTNPFLHEPDGMYVMLLGVDVLPEYRGRGIARAMMAEYVRREKEKGRVAIVLTCLESKISMYEKFGFFDCGISASSWGGESWHEMLQVLMEKPSESYILPVGEGEEKISYLIERVFLLDDKCYFSILDMDTYNVMFGEYLGETDLDEESNRKRIYEDFLNGCKNITFVDGYMEDMLYEVWEDGSL